MLVLEVKIAIHPLPKQYNLNMKTNTKILLLLSIATISIVSLNIILWFSELNQPLPAQSLPQPTLKPTVQQQRLTYTFTGNLPKLATTKPVFTTSPQPNSLEQTAANIAAQLNFSGSPQINDTPYGTSYLYVYNDQSVSIKESPFLISYDNNAQQLQNTLDEQTLITNANQFIQPLISSSINIQLISQTPMQKRVNNIHQAPSFEQADYLALSYAFKLNNTPIISKNHQTYPIDILMNLDGTVRKTTITMIPDQLEEIGTATLSTPAEALEAINNGQGIISTLNDPTVPYTVLEPGEIRTATLSSVEVVYLYDHDINQLQPYYRFAGTAESSLKRTIEIEVLITALPQEVFQQ
jgi:hypothetical protein